MQRVVVFMGGSRDTVAAVSTALPKCVKSLAEQGVVVPRSGRNGNKANGFTHQPLASTGHQGWQALQAEARMARGETILLVVPGMLRLGRSTTRRNTLVDQLSSLADEVTLVSVVVDQLTLINDAYLAQVTAWRTSKRLEAALPRLLDNDVFVHETMLRPWYDESPTHYSALPLNDFVAGHPVSVVLRAGGVVLDGELPAGTAAPPAQLGSVGVEANRLLSTYLRAEIQGFDPTEPKVVAASRAALARAEKLGWCSDRFWGWSRRAADKALARFDASNHRFARAVWDTDWTVPYPIERPCTRVNFLDLDVPVVDQVQRYVVGTVERVVRERAATR